METTSLQHLRRIFYERMFKDQGMTLREEEWEVILSQSRDLPAALWPHPDLPRTQPKGGSKYVPNESHKESD